MSNSKVSINIVVLNGAKYAKFCFDSILKQTYPHEFLDVNILDNGSTDGTQEAITDFKDLFKGKINFIQSRENLGMWPGQEELLKHSNSPYVLVLAIDIILHPDFIIEAINTFGKYSEAGAIQPKVIKFDLNNNAKELTDIIDTCGFRIEKSRRITNIGHGEKDKNQFKEMKIFAVEGACPIFKREALQDAKINGQIIDKRYFWYGDDLDLAWRLQLFGWDQIFAPSVIAWHDRQTTKKISASRPDFIEMRKEIPIKKRRLDWRNVRFTIIKNDYIINILRDFPYILGRELMVLGYSLMYEPSIFAEIPVLLKNLPSLLRDRREIMKKAKRSPREIRKWFS